MELQSNDCVATYTETAPKPSMNLIYIKLLHLVRWPQIKVIHL